MIDALTLDQMRVFATVAETGSFRAAAARLGRVQSAVSHAIGNLEAQLGVELFDRSGHRPALTPEARSLLADTRAILLKVDKMRARARGLGDGVELGLTVALDPQAPQELVSRAMQEMQTAWPSVSLRILTASLGEAVHALRESRCTLSVSGVDIPDPGIERQTLTFVRRAAVVAASHPLARFAAESRPASSEELAEHVQVVVEDPSPLTKGQDFDVLSPGTWRVADNATKHALILAGIGWGNLPLWLVERDLAEGRLQRVPTVEVGERGETCVRIYLMHRTDVALGPAARALRATLLRLAEAAGAG
ncbi:LysR family transcriptional regulator [Stappia sp. MMSF_3263]|uniref:LysR family transcriptional regulator n=1 Tax=Stappia sp. MMSF_3263 TaxID=3046693 RepID=UPI00274008BB|nr:LysR family transcriptional regulator [Stappia sp. MMSF_3263]